MTEGSSPVVPDTQLPDVSIIIVNHNGRRFLPVCLGSLKLLDYPGEKLEVIVVDNASTDDSVAYTQKEFPGVKILSLDKNYGFCKPNNDGAKAAAGQYLVILNNDTEVNREWLKELLAPALADKDVVSCACKMLYYDRRDIVNTTGGKITIIGGGFYRGYGDKDGALYDQPGYTSFGCGAGVLVRKDFFLEAGGFDEDYFAACEEHDLGWRAWLYGYKVAYVPAAVMYHMESGTFGSRSNADPTKVFLNTRNRLFNMLKNLDGCNVVRSKFISFGFNFYRLSAYLFNGNFRAAGAICRAYFDFALNVGKMLSKRRAVQRKRRRSDEELYKLGVIATLKESLAEERRLSRLAGKQFFSSGRQA
ncbi:MAG: glycosyltransferase family 2 protein [Dehalococcoidia bacterium]